MRVYKTKSHAPCGLDLVPDYASIYRNISESKHCVSCSLANSGIYETARSSLMICLSITLKLHHAIDRTLDNAGRIHGNDIIVDVILILR